MCRGCVIHHLAHADEEEEQSYNAMQDNCCLQGNNTTQKQQQQDDGKAAALKKSLSDIRNTGFQSTVKSKVLSNKPVPFGDEFNAAVSFANGKEDVQ